MGSMLGSMKIDGGVGSVEVWSFSAGLLRHCSWPIHLGRIDKLVRVRTIHDTVRWSQDRIRCFCVRMHWAKAWLNSTKRRSKLDCKHVKDIRWFEFSDGRKLFAEIIWTELSVNVKNEPNYNSDIRLDKVESKRTKGFWYKLRMLLVIFYLFASQLSFQEVNGKVYPRAMTWKAVTVHKSKFANLQWKCRVDSCIPIVG